MKISISYEFDSCRQCPFKSKFQDMGASSDLCSMMDDDYVSIPVHGFHPDCPLKDGDKFEKKYIPWGEVKKVN